MLDHPHSQITVVIASSLKPVRDVRAWGKLGISLRETNKYAINIIGFSAKKIEIIAEANSYSSKALGRSRWSRIRAIARFTKLLIQIRPQILICCTYEYLPIARLLKKLIGYKLVYDVQENYIANLELNPELAPKTRLRLANLIRKMERPKGIDLHLLAESCYQSEMPDKSPFLVLENKFAGALKPNQAVNLTQKAGFHFLISGTLSPVFGTVEAIRWFKKILPFYPDSTLTVTGHVTLDFYQTELKKSAENFPSISLAISKNPVPHEQLLKAYEGKDFLLLPYQKHAAIWDKMPSKLFESAALGVPVLITPNPKWANFLAQHRAGFSIDFSKSGTPKLDFQSAISQNYFTQMPDQSLFWSSQEQAFIEAIESLISK